MRRAARRIGAVVAPAALALACSVSAASAGTLYTNNYNDQQVAALTIGADGLLTPIAGSPFTTEPLFPQYLAIAPDGRQMIIGYAFDNEVGTAALAPDGTPTIGTPIPVSTGGAPAISPDGRFVYLPDDLGQINVFALGTDGSLTPVGSPVPAEGFEAALTPDGRYLLLPEEEKEAVQRFAVQADGSLVPLGSTPVAGVGPRVIRTTPDGQLALLLSNDEASSGDNLRTFAIGADGSLTPTGSSLATADLVPGAPRIAPNGHFAYVANGNEDSITTYSLGASGALSQIGAPVPTDLSTSRGLAISVDGRFLYVEPFFGEEIQAFAIGADGVPSKIGVPASTGGGSDGVTPLARPSAPIAAFTATPGPPRGTTIFDASASGGSFAPIVAYNWDFGDGTTLSTTSPQVGHNYKSSGVYQVELTVVDANGCVSEFVYTGQTAYCGGRGATLAVDTVPAIFGMRVTRAGKAKGKGKAKAKAKASAVRRKRPKPRRLAVHYKLSEAARVTFTVQRKLKRLRTKNCKVPTARQLAALRPCLTRFRTVGSFSAQGKAGKNVKPLPRKIDGRPLKPGSYLLTAVAVDSAGGKSTPRSARFKVKKPRPRRR